MEALERYVRAHSEPEDALLQELDRETHLCTVAPRMVSGHIQGRLLELLVRMLRPQRVLEIGTFTGYSALSMAAGLEEGARLDTVEVDDELEEVAQSYFDRSPHGAKIRLHIGSALEIAPRLATTFDLVFIDGDKREYPDYYRMLLGDTSLDADRRQHPLVGKGRRTRCARRPPHAGAAGVQPHGGRGPEGGERHRPAARRTESDKGKITMEIKELQERVDAWIRTYGVRYFSELTNMACLTEEVGELARIMARTYGDQSFKAGEKKNLADEMADVLWVLVCLANQTGVDLTAAMEANFAKKTARDRERHLHNEKLRD